MMLVVCSVLGQILLTLYLQFTLSSVQSSVLSGLFGVILVQTLKILYKPVATALNDRENYRTETQHEDGLIIKVWMFDFVNVFSRLIY